MLKSPGKPVLIFGPTGNVGTHVVKHALKLHDDVHVFVRNPDKLPVDIKESVHVIVGDVADATAVATAVTSVSPEAIIMCSAHRPKDPVAPLNAIAIATIVKVLRETHRLNDCFVIYLSGMFSDLAEDPLPWYAKTLRAVLVPLSGHRASLSDNLEVTKYLTAGEGLKSGLQFTIVRMGYPIEAASKGTIVPVDYNPPGAVTFDDIGAFLVKLAHGEHRQVVLGKAIKPFYAKP
jgi:nucleoside-diphosphate-sugar epimerase